MPRLPQPGGDVGQWGDILNDFLSASHNSDGSIKGASIGSSSLNAGAGSNGQVLSYDSSVAGGFRWISIGGIIPVGGDLSGTADNAQIVANAVSTTEIASAAVTNAKLAAGAVATGNIQDNAITTAKVGDTQITEAKLSTAVQTKLNTSPSTTPADGSLTPVKLNADTPSNGEVLSYNSGNFEWITPAAGGGGGEANTASNIGSVGVGVYRQKTGVNLEFKNVAAASNKVTVANNVGNNTVDIDVVTANLGLTKSDVGLGNVDNTSDANKPISNATQTALDGKASTSHTHTLDNLSDVSTAGATDGQSLVYQSGNWGPATVSSGGVTDHGALTGLSDDDHPQYLNNARGDARYYTQPQVDSSLAGKANTTHGHAISDVTGLQTDLNGKASTTTTVTGATSLTGGGDLSANRTISLVNDSATPGNSYYYGTNGSGTKGYFTLPAGNPTMGGDLSGTASNAQIVAGAVGTVEIADANVTNAKLADNAVTAVKINDGSVTSAKLGNNAVSTNRIQDNAVTDIKIAADAVTTAKILNANVTLAKLESSVQSTLAASIGEVVLDKQWLVSGPINVASGDIDYILPVYVSIPSGYTAQVTGARARINSGTNAVIGFQKNGVAYTGVANMTVTTTGVSQTGLTASLANGDLIGVVVNSTSGSPMNMTVQLTYRIIR